jgi:hypothetical protein
MHEHTANTRKEEIPSTSARTSVSKDVTSGSYETAPLTDFDGDDSSSSSSSEPSSSSSDGDSFGEATDDCEPDQKFLDSMLVDYHPDRIHLLHPNPSADGTPGKPLSGRAMGKKKPSSSKSIGNKKKTSSSQTNGSSKPSSSKSAGRKPLSPKPAGTKPLSSNLIGSKSSSLKVLESKPVAEKSSGPSKPVSATSLARERESAKPIVVPEKTPGEIDAVENEASSEIVDTTDDNDVAVDAAVSADEVEEDDDEEDAKSSSDKEEEHDVDEGESEDAFETSPTLRRNMLESMGKSTKKSLRRINGTFWSKPFKNLGKALRKKDQDEK